MRRTKNRPQYIKDLVEKTNKYLELSNIKDQSDTLFRFMCDLLLEKNMYEGFNFYIHKTMPINGELKTFLVNPSIDEFHEGKWDCLQIY